MASQWNVDDQIARLAELTSHDSDLKEAPLRRDVRSLGRLLGEVLKEQVGIELYAAVEELRRLLIEQRETSSTTSLIERAEKIVSQMDVEQAHQMTKAFAIYFELTNLAETNHRKRRRRAGRSSPETLAQPGSFLGTLRRMRAAMKAEGILFAQSKFPVSLSLLTAVLLLVLGVLAIASMAFDAGPLD